MLALIGRGGAGPHDIVDMVRRGGRIHYAAAPSKIYAEPKRLEKLGHVRSSKQPGKTRERTHYTLSEKGLTALVEWLARPSPLPRIHNEAAVRVMAGDLIDDQALAAGLGGLRAELAEHLQRVEQAEAIAATIPHRARYLKLVNTLGRRLLEVQLEWIEQVERELNGA